MINWIYFIIEISSITVTSSHRHTTHNWPKTDERRPAATALVDAHAHQLPSMLTSIDDITRHDPWQSQRCMVVCNNWRKIWQNKLTHFQMDMQKMLLCTSTLDLCFDLSTFWNRTIYSSHHCQWLHVFWVSFLQFFRIWTCFIDVNYASAIEVRYESIVKEALSNLVCCSC